MRVTLIQMDIQWGDIAANCNVASRLIDAIPGSNLYVLPEMFSTGFAVEPQSIADVSGQSLVWMQGKARETGAAICGSVSVKCEDGTYRNRFYFMKPDGGVTFYDKHHLFTYGGEDKCYKAGQERVIVEWGGVRFLLMVCYDLRFPVWARNHEDYDAILYVASWPTSRVEVWRTLLKARAIENQCYVIGVNRVGKDAICQYCGSTAFVDPYVRATECPANEQTTVTGEINMPKLEAFREKFPVLKDRD